VVAAGVDLAAGDLVASGHGGEAGGGDGDGAGGVAVGDAREPKPNDPKLVSAPRA
jgi:hypothetical protein